MMLVKMPSFSNVTEGQTAVIPRLPLGDMYHAIQLTYGGTVFDQGDMTGIRLIIDGKTVWNITGTHLDLLNNYRKLTDASATKLTMWFADPTLNDQVQKQIGSIDTAAMGVREMSIECDLSGTTAPTLRADAIISPSSPKADRFAGVFRSMLKMTQTPAAAGQHDFPVALGSRSGAFISSVAFVHANITSLAVKRDGRNHYDDLTNAIIGQMNGQTKRAVQSGLVVFDPVALGDAEDMVSTVRGDGTPANFEFLPTVSAADTVTIYSEIITTLERV